PAETMRSAMNSRYYRSLTDRPVGPRRHLLELNADTKFWSVAAAHTQKPPIFRAAGRHDYCTIPRNFLEGERHAKSRTMARGCVSRALAGARVGADEQHRRNRQGHVGRDSARRDRGSLQPGADRKDA